MFSTKTNNIAITHCWPMRRRHRRFERSPRRLSHRPRTHEQRTHTLKYKSTRTHARAAQTNAQSIHKRQKTAWGGRRRHTASTKRWRGGGDRLNYANSGKLVLLVTHLPKIILIRARRTAYVYCIINTVVSV